jgi:hypothetical protein
MPSIQRSQSLSFPSVFSLEQALALVQFKLSALRISPKLSAYLIQYEAILHGANSMRLVDGSIVEK